MNLQPFPAEFDIASLVSVRVEAKAENDRVLDVGTAFWFRPASGKLYLVTNWHIVAGRQPQMPKISRTGAVPTKLVARLHFRGDENLLNTESIGHLTIKLNSADGEEPRWLEHPDLRYRADVVAIEIDNIDRLQEQMAIAAIGDEGVFDRTPKFVPNAMHDVFVIGYPWGLTGGTRAFPIYKRGSIASEPGLSQAGLPRFLIDCRTARGMSGSPVIAGGMVAGAAVGKGNEPLLFANAKVFAGIYSGRLQESDLQSESADVVSLREEAAAAISEIGIVWRRDVLFEIVAAGTPGSKLSQL